MLVRELLVVRKLQFRHNLDVMHIEKNVFDNVFNTMMDIKGKTKDNEKARMDLREYCKRSELHLRNLPNGKLVKPKACFALTKDEKEELCTWIENLRMPDGYASNLARCVDKSRHKLHGMKSHDCHVFMQRLLLFAFMNSLPPAVYKVITELSQFFRNLCCTELLIDELHQMEKNILVILCKLERIFPPGFFDVMEHLLIHLPYEALVCGPVQYRWMYPFERFLHDLKGIVKNRARVEGSICEAYIAQETAYFSLYYFESHIQSKSTRSRRNEFYPSTNQTPSNLSIFNHHVRHAGQCTTRWLTDEEYKVASLHVLTQCDEVVPFMECYKSAVRHYVPGITENDVQLSFENHFVKWFKEYMTGGRKDKGKGIAGVSRGNETRFMEKFASFEEKMRGLFVTSRQLCLPPSHPSSFYPPTTGVNKTTPRYPSPSPPTDNANDIDNE